MFTYKFKVNYSMVDRGKNNFYTKSSVLQNLSNFNFNFKFLFCFDIYLQQHVVHLFTYICR